MNSMEYDILYLKYRISLFIILLFLSITLLLIIILCNKCTENLMLDYLILIISMCVILMIISTYYIISLQMKLDFLLSIDSIVDMESFDIDYIDEEYDKDIYNNEL